MEAITLFSKCCEKPIEKDRDGTFVCSECKRAVPPEVFISYHGGGGNEKRSSYPEALLLKKYFADRGIPAFVCRSERRSNFKKAISEALRDANHFVLVAKDIELISSSGWIIDDEIEKFDTYIKNSRNPGELVKKPREAVMTAYLYGGLTREELTVHTDAFLTRDVIIEGQGGFESIFLMISRAILETRRRERARQSGEINILTPIGLSKNEDTDKAGGIKKAAERSAALSGFVFSRLTGGGYAVGLSDSFSFKGEGVRLEIPSEYCSEAVVEIAEGGFRDKSFIGSVIIPHTVRKIGNNAFSGCDSLTEVILGENLTELGEGAFSDCLSLESMLIPEGVRIIPARLFQGCVNLRELTLPAGLGGVGRAAFKGCSSLSHTSSEGGRYLGNNRNPYLVLTRFTGKKSYSVNPKCRIIGEGAFSELPLTRIMIPRDTVSVSDSAFSDCKRLREVVFEGNRLENIGASAFFGCERLSLLKLPGSVRVIGERAFAHCERLSDISLSNKLTEVSVECFVGTAVTELTLGEEVKSIGNSAFDSSSLVSIRLSEGTEHIANCAFADCAELKSVTLPLSIKVIEPYAFLNLDGVRIYYSGGESDFREVKVGFENSAPSALRTNILLDSIELYYYSENAPGERGRFWHLVNGEPKEW